jgi:ADP-heptose:LPS heptosyltransferase
MARIVIIRLSALGDVAISVPLVHALADQYPEHEFVMVSQPQMSGLFSDCPSNVQFVSAGIYGKHKGILGLYRLFRELKATNVDVVCDMHNVIRTRILGYFFKLMRIPVFRIDKQRSERLKLTRIKNKEFRQLKTSFQNYRDVFAKAGLSLNYFDAWPKLEVNQINLAEMEALFGKKKTRWLGFAPFAKHSGKIYPFELSEKVLAHFAKDSNYTVFLLGGGKEEMAHMQKWKEKYPSLLIPTGLFLKDEVRLMSCMDLIFAMDSANMHLGSLARTPVVSVWGSTHPYTGFYGLYQDERNIVQDDIACRPCSVFGNKPCFRKDYACLNRIKPEQIIEKIEHVLARRPSAIMANN